MFGVLLFTMFGVMMASVAGLISSFTDTTKQITLDRTEATRSFFEQAADIFNNRITVQEMEIRNATTCGTVIYSLADPRPYLCRLEIRQLSSWDMGANNITDAWRNPVTGVVARRDMAVGPGVIAPVTAMAFVSGGPNGVVEPNLAAAITALIPQAQAGTASLQDIQRLSASLDAITGSDDIVYTFTNQKAMQQRWEGISSHVDHILFGMQQSYMQQYNSFTTVLQQYYADNPANLSVLYGWKSAALPDKPTLAVPNLNTTAGRLQLGLQESINAITLPMDDGGSSLAITHVSSSSDAVAWPDERDVMSLEITNSGSPWTVNYSKTLSMAP